MTRMPKDYQERLQANKRKWFCGNQSAVDFSNILFLSVELWDDLIDKDRPVTDDRVNEIMTGLMWALPANQWFHEHRHFYMPLILVSINAFHDSNDLAKSDELHLRNLAFHLRNLGLEINVATAFLCGGFAHMRAVSREMREFFAFESFEEWEHHHA